MMPRLRFATVLAALFLSLMPAAAVQPDEILDDPALEARARAISAQLRCMVCQNQSIDDSDAELARDLRILVRERLKAGDSNREVFDYIVSRYGEFVLLKPRLTMKTAALWGAPIIVLAFGVTAVAMFLRGRRKESASTPLSDAEEVELRRILDRRGRS